MKIVVDNNVAIDALLPRPPFDTDAKEIFRAFEDGKMELYITANSITDIYYVLRKGKPERAALAKAVIAKLIKKVHIIPLTEDDCAAALDLQMDDYEDAPISVCARKIQADCIVSRDEAFLHADSPVKVVSPARLVSNNRQK